MPDEVEHEPLTDFMLQMEKDRFVFERSVEGRGFLFNNKTGEVFSLNSTGAFVVDRLLRSVPLPRLKQEMSEAFSIQQEDAELDLQDFFRKLCEFGLLKGTRGL